jgi:hydroxypyruvate isomerase
MLFTELPFLDRFAAAKAAGFTAVEYLFPYEFPKETLAGLLRKHGLKQVLHNLPAGDWAAGERGIACHPDRIREFSEGVSRAIEYAHALDCPQLNCLAGKVPHGVRVEEAKEVLVENLRFAAGLLRSNGIRLLIEPINHFDIPGFFLTRTEQAISIIEEVASDNLRLQYDIYHAQRMEGELAGTLQKHLPRIGHIQLADNPGRNEPGTGEINWRFLLAHIDAIGWKGHIGCEYKPKVSTTEGLHWMEELTQ